MRAIVGLLAFLLTGLYEVTIPTRFKNEKHLVWVMQLSRLITVVVILFLIITVVKVWIA